jgi:hypothetical protein
VLLSLPDGFSSGVVHPPACVWRTEEITSAGFRDTNDVRAAQVAVSGGASETRVVTDVSSIMEAIEL